MFLLKRNSKLILPFLILIIWVVFAQSCMKFRISDSKAKEEFLKVGVNLETKFAETGNFKLHYAKTGVDTLPTLLFIHGSPGGWNAFEEYMKDKDLLEKYRMISIDRPGFGYSKFGHAKKLKDQSKIISGFLPQLSNNKPIYIIGHSLGGPLAVKLAAENPTFFQGIVLLASSVSAADEAPEKWRGLLHNTPLKYLLPGAFKASNSEIWYFKKEVTELALQFKFITCKVWIIHGDKDKFVPVANAAYAQKMLINASFVNTKILNNAPHFIPWKPWYDSVKNVILTLN